MSIKGLVLVSFIFSFSELQAGNFPLVTASTKITILYNAHGSTLDSIAAHLLAGDIERVTSYKPAVLTDLSSAKGSVILIGNLQSEYIQKILGTKSDFYKALQGKWECFGLKIINKPTKKITQALVIAGSDVRGTAYGVFTLAEKIGISPWYWWADVPVEQKKELSIDLNDFVSSPPSVKYRGIFINDEDWGLQPWAAKTLEPETGDIGPKTYAKVFELLLRLKANLIWPAMHPCTKAFYSYPGNKKIAADYAIIIGSSHAEPMLRNNVGEWNVKTMGAFNYITNKNNVYNYWEERMKESRINDVIYTIGMRGVHDSGIEGVKDPKEAVPLLERIIADQRGLMEKYAGKKATDIPQVFTTYKEVLDIYDLGLKVPDDVTLVWPDDNYGYIRRLNNEKEKKRSGGSGVYYHASYWGRPHDYLWLGTTHPSLIQEEMMKAYENGSTRLWVLNVGDIKPLEYATQLFMDMAFYAEPFKESSYTQKHLRQWLTGIFGTRNANQLTDVLWNYYQLAFERRPEFMGWSQTEPTTKTGYTTYHHFYYGDEAQRRIDRYNTLQRQVTILRNQTDATHADAFYELIYYPVVCASLMNKKFLYHDKAYLYSKQRRRSAVDYAELSKQVYDSIIKETDFYNQQLAGGKWKYVMSMKPRNLPVFQEPALPVVEIQPADRWHIAPEGCDTSYFSKNIIKPPETLHFSNSTQQHFIDIFLCDTATVQWTASTSNDWIVLSASNGTLMPSKNKNQQRLWVSVNREKTLAMSNGLGQITFDGAMKKFVVNIATTILNEPEINAWKGFVEENGYVSIHAQHTGKTVPKESSWKIAEGLGHTGSSIVSSVVQTHAMDTVNIAEKNGFVTYDFYSFTETSPLIYLFTLPVHPVNDNFSLRYAISIDNGPLRLIDFKTVGRSDEWKQNVLRNSAIKKVSVPLLRKGKHTLTVYAVDPGVILDRIVIDLGGLKNSYGVIPETVAR